MLITKDAGITVKESGFDFDADAGFFFFFSFVHTSPNVLTHHRAPTDILPRVSIIIYG